MIRPLRSELRHYAGIQPVAVFAMVTGLGVAQALQGMRSIHLHPHIAPDTYALASPAGALTGAAQHMATVGGVGTAVLIAYYGWIVDYQHGMMPTLLLFERRRWVLLIRKLAAATVAVATVFAAGWAALWIAVNLALSLGEPAVTSPAVVTWPQSLELVGRSAIVSLGYVSMAVLAACLTRRLVPTAVILAGLWLATLPLTPIHELRAYLPHVWIATWMRLPDNLQFITYFWPSTDPVVGDEGLHTIAIFTIAAVAAICAYLTGPATRAED